MKAAVGALVDRQEAIMSDEAFMVCSGAAEDCHLQHAVKNGVTEPQGE